MSARENRQRREEAHKNKVLGLIEEREDIEKSVERKNVEIAKAIEAAQKDGIVPERIGVWLGISRAGVYMFCQRWLGRKKDRMPRGRPRLGRDHDRQEDKTKVKIRTTAKPKVRVRQRQEV